MPKGEVKRVEKPWGYELIWAHTPKYVGKILHINQGHKLSLQYHEIKEETIYILRGKMEFLFEETKGSALSSLVLSPGDTYHIAVGRLHRMIALEDTDVLEVSTPELDDVVRIEDAYKRV